MFYQMHDIAQAGMMPARHMAHVTKLMATQPLFENNPYWRLIGASAEMFERATRRFGKPEFGLDSTIINGKTVAVHEETVLEKPFCTLTRFVRDTNRNDPKVLIVAPLSGHFATLLRGTVEALLPHHDVYITEWIDARLVPISDGRFNLDDYIAYCIEFMRHLAPDLHVMAVCQPAVPVFAAVSLMAGLKDKQQPASMTLMGGPIDPRVSKTAVTELAEQRPLSWFENTVIAQVPLWYPGATRHVYPGFIQLSGFMSMNLDRHVGSHMQFFQHLIEGDGDSAESHRFFYNEYMAVMDLPAEFYLQTVEYVFQRHSLPLGEMKWRNPKTGHLVSVDPGKIRQTALLTVEGELDDISALGQTEAAHGLACNLSKDKKFHHCHPNVGHYGIFNGSRWRTQIMPRIRHFIRRHGEGYSPLPAADLKTVPNLKPNAHRD